jgi:lysozyme
MEGVDVSQFQGTIDWKKVRASGRTFAYAKATAGINYGDPTFAQNYAAIKAAGLLRGAFHTLAAGVDGKMQADKFISTIGTLQPGDLPPALDVEPQVAVSASVLQAEIGQWMAQVQAVTGRTPIVYSSGAGLQQALGSGTSGDLLWISNYGVACPTLPAGAQKWVFWQYADNGAVPGIPGAVDLNRFNGNLVGLNALAKSSKSQEQASSATGQTLAGVKPVTPLSPATTAPPPAANQPATNLASAPAAAPLAVGEIRNKVAPAAPNCTITAMDINTGVVTATESATGKIFQFKLIDGGVTNDAALLKSLNVGQGVYANFAANVVSLNGLSPDGTILSSTSSASTSSAASAATGTPGQMHNNVAPVPLAAAQPAGSAQTPGAQRVSPPPVATKPSSTGAGLAHTVPGSALIPLGLPSVTAGTPQLVPHGGPQMAPIGPLGNRVNQDVVHLRGAAGIQQASGLPEGAKNLLLLHVNTLAPGEVDHYIVNKKLATDWIAAHPALANVKPPASHDSGAGCSVTITNPCLGADVQHISDQTSQQINNLLDAGRKEWQQVTGQLSQDLKAVEGCFADQTLHLNDVPVEISPNDVPDLTFSFDKGGKPNSAVKANNQFGAITGSAEVTGKLTFGLPMDAHFKAGVDMFWIECLPFFIRPKNIHADGTFAVGTKIGAELTATGQFTQEFNIAAGRTPIAIIPIVIAGIPIAEMDVSAYMEGKVLVDGNGRLDAKFSLETQRQTYDFDFACSGHGCPKPNFHGGATKPETTSEYVKLDGRIHVKPEVYVALQLDFDFDALTARAGPQPYLLGEVCACGAASGTQTAGGPSTSQDSYALTADLDWGIDLRAEAMVGGALVGDRAIRTLLQPRHIAFWDLAHSTALLPRAEGLTQASMGQPAHYQFKMPACYPYPDKVKYQLTWTGGATASNVAPGTTVASGASGTSAATRSKVQPDALLKVGGNGTPSSSTSATAPCSLQSGQGYCEFDPVKDFALDLAWPVAGTYNLTVTAIGDTPHGREYKSAQPTTLNVTVGSSGSGTSTSASNGGTPPAPPSGSGTSTSASNGGTPPAPPPASGTTTSASNGGTSSAPPPPCCVITAVDPSSGVATSKVMSTGEIFLFKVTDSATLKNLQVGQRIYANLPARRVSLNGMDSFGEILSVSPAQAVGAGTQTSSSNQATRVTNPQAMGIYRDPNPNHLPDLVPDIGTAFGECSIPAGSTCQASCGSKKIPTNLGVHNLTQYPANGPIQILLREIASGAVVQNWTVNGVGVDLKQWAYPGGFYTMWPCPTTTSFPSSPPDNYTLEVQGPPQLTTGPKIKQFYIPPDAVRCAGYVDWSGCQQ